MFVHSARTPADIIFRDELALMARAPARASAPSRCARPMRRASAGTAFAAGCRLPMLRLIAPDLLEREIFTCGPAPYMAAVRAMLREWASTWRATTRRASISPSWPAASREVPADGAGRWDDQAAPSRSSFTRSGATSSAAPTPRAGAARAAGMRLPSSCTKGMCGTCKSRLVSGTVEMSTQGGIRQREIDAGDGPALLLEPYQRLVVERELTAHGPRAPAPLRLPDPAELFDDRLSPTRSRRCAWRTGCGRGRV